MPTFEQVYALLLLRGPGRAESSKGTVYRIEARNGNIVAFLGSGHRVTIHEKCWGRDITCKGSGCLTKGGSRAGGVYNGPYSIYDWFRENR